MKKILLAAAVLAFGFAKAQSNEIKFGVKAGFTHSTFTGDGYYADSYTQNGTVYYGSKSDGKIGGYVGGFADIPLQGNFHLQPEFLISAEGGENAGLVYARVPVLAKYYLFENFSVLAGPQFGVRIAASDHADDFTKAFDFGLTGGASYDFSFGLFVEARFNAGIVDISDIPNREIRNASFMAGAGYRF